MVRQSTTILFGIFVLCVLLQLSACGGSGDSSVPSSGGSGNNGGSNGSGVSDTVSLTWTAPANYSDGSSVAPGELGGFKIYVSQIQDDYSASVPIIINDANANSHSLQLSTSGTHYLVMTAFDAAAVESSYSNQISFCVNSTSCPATSSQSFSIS
ncbi:MAG: hypothetical protein PVF28_01280, partial [Thioalkalispiraceae bacterium]